MISFESIGRLGAVTLLAVTWVLLAAATAYAIPFTTNTRDVLLTEGSPSNEPSLESVLLAEGSYTGGFGQADQSTNALFSPVGDEAVAGLIIEHAGNHDQNELGIYNLLGEEVSVFSGAADAGATELLLFDGDDLVIGSSTYEDFGPTFGFYLRNDDAGFTWYSQDILNDGERAHFLAFEDATTDTVYFGFEDLDLGDHDYNDFVAKISGVVGATGAGAVQAAASEAIPEPTATLLFGVGLLLVGARRRG